MNKFYKRKIAFMLLLAMAAGNNTLAMQKSKPQISELGFKRELNSPKSLNTGAKVGIVLSTSLLLSSLTSFAIWKIMFNNDKVKNLQIKNRDDQLNNLDVQQVEEYNDDKFNDSIEEENNQRDDELLVLYLKFNNHRLEVEISNLLIHFLDYYTDINNLNLKIQLIIFVII